MNVAASTPLDFLSRLVDKARGVDSAIEPRMPSLFEPVFRTDAMPEEDGREQAAPVIAHRPSVDGVEVATSANRRPSEQGASAQIVPRGKAVEWRDEAVRTTDVGHEFRREDEAPPPAATLLPARAATGAPAPAAPPDESDPAVRAEPPAVLVVDHIPREKRAGPSGPAAVRAHAELVAGKTPVIRHAEAALNPSRAKPRARAKQDRGEEPAQLGVPVPETTAALIPRAVIMAEPKRPLASNPETPRGESGQEPPPAVINVTIGRVEVRAVQPPTGRSRVEPAKPKPMSLDDYLKQRGSR